MRSSTRWRLSHACGFGVLLAFSLHHVWEHWPTRDARASVIERLHGRFTFLPGWLEGALLLAALLAYAVGLRWRASGEEAQARSVVRVQRAAGLLLGAFLVWHVGSLWWPARLQEGGVLAALARAEAQLDSLAGSLAYVVGWTALSAQVGFGVWGTGGQGRVERSVPGRASLALLSGLGVWLLGIQVLAAYVAGAPLW